MGINSVTNIAAHPRAVFMLERKVRIKRFREVLMVAFIPIFFLIVFKLLEIQLFRTGFYMEKSREFRMYSATFLARGRILDRNGMILAQDVIVYDLYAHPRYFWEQKREDIAKVLAPALGLSVEKVTQMLSEPADTINLGKNLSKEVAQKVIALNLSGIEAHKKTYRRYPQGTLASHVIGYANDEAKIYAGVESTTSDTLHSMPNAPATQVSARGDYINVHALNPQFLTHIPKANDVALTIDARIQYAAESALKKGLLRAHAERGAAIVLDPKTGEMLAFAVLPDFDPELFYKAKPEALKNWAVTDVYPPGSTMKILTVASGLEAGVIQEDSHIIDTGRIHVANFEIVNHDYAQKGAMGNIDLVTLLQRSSNVASYKISSMIDKVTHYRILRAFGLGRRTGIDITGESRGILPLPSEWSDLTHGTMGYGYGLAATPLQMAAAVASIANGGIWITPHVVKQDANVVRHRSISLKTANSMANILAKSIEKSKTAPYYIPNYDLAGKTGTSRKPSDDGRGYSSNLFTSFVGYFPAHSPKVLIMVVIDSPKVGNAWGATIAGPIFHEIALEAAGYLGIKPVQNTAQPTLTNFPERQG